MSARGRMPSPIEIRAGLILESMNLYAGEGSGGKRDRRKRIRTLILIVRSRGAPGAGNLGA